jgi:tRNA threonylcarbamoyladenosine biosynthesis protein TsaB
LSSAPTNSYHLAIETSGRSGSVSLFDAGRELLGSPLPAGLRTTQSLAPVIENLARNLPRGCRDLRFISVAVGPGSFTGLRIGVTTAKTLAYACGADLVAVNTLEIMAYQALAVASTPELAAFRTIATAMLAYRNQVFGAVWRLAGTSSIAELQSTQEPQTFEIEVWRQFVESISGQQPVLATGDGYRVGWSASPKLRIAPQEIWSPQSKALGEIGWRMFQAGQIADLWRLEPEYLRPSAAEEKLVEGS